MCFSFVFLELSAISLFVLPSGFFWEWRNHATVSTNYIRVTAQKMKFSIKDFFSKCDHLLKKSLMENFIFCAVQSLSCSLWAVFVLCSLCHEWSISKHDLYELFQDSCSKKQTKKSRKQWKYLWKAVFVFENFIIFEWEVGQHFFVLV